MEARVRHSRNQIKSNRIRSEADLLRSGAGNGIGELGCIAEPEHGIGIGNTVTAAILKMATGINPNPYP